MSVELRSRGRNRKRRRSSRESEPAVQASSGRHLPATEHQDGGSPLPGPSSHYTEFQEQSRADPLLLVSSDDEDSTSSKRFRPIHGNRRSPEPGISEDLYSTSELRNRSSLPSLPRVESPMSSVSDDEDYWFQFMTRTDTPVIFSDDEDDEEDVVFVGRLPFPQDEIGLLQQQEMMSILTYNHHPTMMFDPKTMGKQTKCAICLGDYVAGEELMILPCTHNFHRTCLQHWLQQSNTCPVCRREVD